MPKAFYVGNIERIDAIPLKRESLWMMNPDTAQKFAKDLAAVEARIKAFGASLQQMKKKPKRKGAWKPKKARNRKGA